MGNLDLISMIGNLSASMSSVQSLISGLGYVFGVLFIVHAILKLKETIGSAKSAQTGLNVPLAYLVAGAALIYMPSMVNTLAETFFGSSSVLEYTAAKPLNIYVYMRAIIATAGVIWFVRGCVLLAHASDPNSGRKGSKGIGAKGLSFVVMGVFATHLDATISALDGLMQMIFNAFK